MHEKISISELYGSRVSPMEIPTEPVHEPDEIDQLELAGKLLNYSPVDRNGVQLMAQKDRSQLASALTKLDIAVLPTQKVKLYKTQKQNELNKPQRIAFRLCFAFFLLCACALFLALALGSAIFGFVTFFLFVAGSVAGGIAESVWQWERFGLGVQRGMSMYNGYVPPSAWKEKAIPIKELLPAASFFVEECRKELKYNDPLFGVQLGLAEYYLDVWNEDQEFETEVL